MPRSERGEEEASGDSEVEDRDMTTRGAFLGLSSASAAGPRLRSLPFAVAKLMVIVKVTALLNR